MTAHPDTTIRFARPDDADVNAIAEIHVAGWRAAYAGIVPADHLASLSQEERARGWRTAISRDARGLLLFTDAAGVQGWICVGPSREDPGANAGEIYALYVRPGRWRDGIGRQLLAAGERELWERKCPRIVLWVLEQNHPARAFYERMGYASDGGTKEIPFGETRLVELRYAKTQT